MMTAEELRQHVHELDAAWTADPDYVGTTSGISRESRAELAELFDRLSAKLPRAAAAQRALIIQAPEASEQ